MTMDTDPFVEIRTSQAVVEEYLARIHRRDETAFDLVAEDFVNHAVAPQGRAGMREIALILVHDLGNPEIRIHHVVTSGDLVSVHLDLVGTHTGSTSPLLSGVPVTGKPLV